MQMGCDFRQVFVDIEKRSRSDMVHACTKRSVLWSLFHTFHLTANMRISVDEAAHKQWFLQLGNGALATDWNCDLLVTSDLLCGGDIIYAVFGDVFAGLSFELTDAVILTPRSVDSLKLNTAY